MSGTCSVNLRDTKPTEDTFYPYYYYIFTVTIVSISVSLLTQFYIIIFMLRMLSPTEYYQKLFTIGNTDNNDNKKFFLFSLSWFTVSPQCVLRTNPSF